MRASTLIRDVSQLKILNGEWHFQPENQDAQKIIVPALWESQGHLNLDGKVLYWLDFDVTNYSTFSTLRFEAVMDHAKVTLNSIELGESKNPFTPFELDTSNALRPGRNRLEVEVSDFPLGSDEHVRSAHGKQGWANQEFPSPPSVYMTLGGIFRDVTLHLHQGIVIRNITSNNDPSNLIIGVEIENLGKESTDLDLVLTLFGEEKAYSIQAPSESRITHSLAIDASTQSRWSPQNPNLHTAKVELNNGGQVLDSTKLTFGLRRIVLANNNIEINGEPIYIRSALVQGFYPGTIYGEPSDEEIRDEVLKAKSLGLNMLRLHIKAFDTRYLDICDQLGMLLHCDIPIAEPIAHLELASDSLVGQNCLSTIEAQVYRDYSHPSIVLWSAMNELGLERIEIRQSEGYKSFAIAMYEELERADGTRPIIENDWIDPDPEFIFRSEILTSHWYGRLDSRYLSSLRKRCSIWGADPRYFFVSEFGDWGLPDMPTEDDSEFWSYHHYYAASFADIPWSAPQSSFIEQSQRYMGVADKLQMEIFRSVDGVDGYCITELTDIPWELNGLLDYRRNVKEGTAGYIRQANQEVLPSIEFDFAGVESGKELLGVIHLHNASNAEISGEISVGFASNVNSNFSFDIPGNSLLHFPLPKISSEIPEGVDSLIITCTQAGAVISSNSYEVPVYPVRTSAHVREIRKLSNGNDSILERLGAQQSETSTSYVVGEGALTPEIGLQVKTLLENGANVLVLAQTIETSAHMPIQVEAISSTTEWGGTDFHFTTADSHLFGENLVLVSEDLNIRPDVIFSKSVNGMWPEQTHVGVFKPMPRPRQGYIVGVERVGTGRLITCQYRLNETADLISTQAIADKIFKLAFGQDG